MEDAAKPPFDSIYSQGFVRVAVAMPRVEVAAPEFNTSQMLQLAGQATSADSVLVVFPELGISAYSNEDLFLQDALLDAIEAGLDRLLFVRRKLPRTAGELLAAPWEGIDV